jgi:hypothetical protein
MMGFFYNENRLFLKKKKKKIMSDFSFGIIVIRGGKFLVLVVYIYIYIYIYIF